MRSVFSTGCVLLLNVAGMFGCSEDRATTNELAIVFNHVQTLESACSSNPRPRSLAELVARSNAHAWNRFKLVRPFSKDPWGNDYVVQLRRSEDWPHIFSCGPDGQPDTADDTRGEPPDRRDRVPFDPRVYLLDGRPVTEVLERLANGPENERELGAYQLWCVYKGEIESATSGRDLPDEEGALRREAAQGRIDARANVVVPALTSALDDLSAKVRRGAAHCLRAIGPEGLGACEKLRERLLDPDPKVKVYAAAALYEIRREIKAPFEVCTRMLRDEDPEIRIIASSVLGGMGKEARPAIPVMESMLEDPDEGVRKSVSQDLESIRSGR